MKFPRFARNFSFRQTMLFTTGCFVLVTLGMSVVAIVSRNYSKQGTRQTETLTRELLPSLVMLTRLQKTALNLKSINFQFALARNEEAMAEQNEAFQSYSQQVGRNIAELQGMEHDGATQQLLTAFAVDMRRYRESAEKFQAELRASDFTKAMATLDHEIGPAQRAIETQLHELSERYFQLSHEAGARTGAVLARSDRFGLFATVMLSVFTLLCLVLSLGATRALLLQAQRRDAERQAANATLERRVAERTADLRASEERIRLIVDTASDAIVTIDANGAIYAWNRQAEKIFGWSATEAAGRDFLDALVAPKHREAQRRWFESIRAGHDVTTMEQHVEILALHRSGKELPVEVAVSPVRWGDTVLLSAFIRDITERRRAEAELAEIHAQLVKTSRQAGMAEIATGVLHNIGNVLNSVNVSATIVAEQCRRTKAAGVAKLSAMMNHHQPELGSFVTQDPRGKMIPEYLRTLAGEIENEKTSVLKELGQLVKNVEHIKDIVAMQQTYARVSGVIETISVPEIVEDALRMNIGSLDRHDVRIVRDYQARPVVTTDKHKVMQILINLIRNAKYACDESGRTDKVLTLRCTEDSTCVKIAVIDNGVGITPENLQRLFVHGFTTRKHGHGFGLHSGAVVAQELGGALKVHSDGPGQGATFVLELPRSVGGTSRVAEAP